MLFYYIIVLCKRVLRKTSQHFYCLFSFYTSSTFVNNNSFIFHRNSLKLLTTSALHLSANTMKRLGKSTNQSKAKVSKSIKQKQNEPEEEPLVVSKVIRQYTRKKKVECAESVNKVASIANRNEVAACSDQIDSTFFVYNHVKIKEEIVDRFPDIEIMAVNDEIQNHVKTEEKSKTQNGFNKKDNFLTMDIQKVTEIRLLNSNNSYENCTNSKVNNYVKIKEENGFETELMMGISLQPIGSNREDSTINIKEENGSEIVIIAESTDVNSNSNLSDTLIQETTNLTTKIELEENLQLMNLEQNAVDSETDVQQSEKGVAGEIKPKTEVNCNSDNEYDKIVTSQNGKLYVPGQNDQKVICQPNNRLQTLHLDNNVPARQEKILITEEIHIKEEVDNNEEDFIEIKDKVQAEHKREPTAAIIEKGNLRRIMNVPRILKTYGKNQPEPVSLKKCFLVPVHGPPSNFQKYIAEKLAKYEAKNRMSQIFICDACGKDCKSRKSVSAHVQRAHGLSVKHACGVCAAAFPHHYLLLAHRRAHRAPPFRCGLCPKSYRSRAKYGEHLNTHLRERLYTCPVCLRRFTVILHLRNHVQRHTPEETFPCEYCKESYRSVVDLRRHCEREHEVKVEFPCFICTRILHSTEEFYTHMQTHDNVMHICAFCPRRFLIVCKWEEHSADHIEKLSRGEVIATPFKCEYCKKPFKYKSVLKTHIRMHTGERPYECPVCFKKLKTQSAMSEHINGHKRPYTCYVCEHRFGKRDSLSRHMLLHTGERPHACPGCPWTFVQRSSMLKHVRRHHQPGLKRMRKSKKNTANKTKTKNNV